MTKHKERDIGRREVAYMTESRLQNALRMSESIVKQDAYMHAIEIVRGVLHEVEGT